jgi:hypothetical protein
MLTKDEAEDLVLQQIGDNDVEVVETLDVGTGWLVFWNSGEYVRSRDPFRMIVGIPPRLVDKKSGEITRFSAHSWREELERSGVRVD